MNIEELKDQLEDILIDQNCGGTNAEEKIFKMFRRAIIRILLEKQKSEVKRWSELGSTAEEILIINHSYMMAVAEIREKLTCQ